MISKRLNGSICFVCMLLVLTLASCQTQVPLESPLTASELSSQTMPTQPYRVQIGDSVDVFVLEDDSFNGVFNVRPSGDIIMPKVGRVALQGYTLSESEARIRQSLEANHLRKATVIVDPGNRGQVDTGLVIRTSGCIAQTGRITLKPLGVNPFTAYQAVVEAGGFKPFANRKKGYILRQTQNGVVRIPVNFEAIESGKLDDPQIVAGDCIVVPQKSFGL